MDYLRPTKLERCGSEDGKLSGKGEQVPLSFDDTILCPGIPSSFPSNHFFLAVVEVLDMQILIADREIQVQLSAPSVSLSPSGNAEGNSRVLVLRQLLRFGALTAGNWLSI